MTLVIGAFATREQAAAAVDQVVAGGCAPEQVSVLGRGRVVNQEFLRVLLARIG